MNSDTLITYGAEIKALGDGRVGGYLIRYGNPKDADMEGDFFNAGTEYGVTEGSQLPVYYNHGLDETVKRKRIGRGPIKFDDVGLWFEAQLDLRDEYEEKIYELAEMGKLGWSSGAAGHLVEREKKGKSYWIKSWPIAEASLTPTPAEPRNSAIPIKSLITTEAASADKDDEMTAGKTANTTPKPEKAKENTMEKEELKTFLDEQGKSISASLETKLNENTEALMTQMEEKVEAAAEKALETKLDALPEVKALFNGEALEVTEAEEDKEFKSVGENLAAVAKHVRGHGTHPRIRGLAAKEYAVAQAAGDEKAMEASYKALLGSNESIPSQGQFLLEPTITREIIKPVHETGVFSTKVRRLPVGPNSNSGWIPGIDETSRATGSRWGGVRGYHLAEAATMTASQPSFRRINWELNKVAVLQYATDELLNDVGMLTSIVNQSSAEELNFMVNDDILNGDGVGKPLGVDNQPCLISVPRVTLLQVNHNDIVAMWQRLHPRNRSSAAWYINSEVEPQLAKLAFVSNAATTEMMSPYVSYGTDGVMRIMGKPVYVTEFNAALGTKNDILLADFGEYLFWEKGAIEAAMSIHVQFLTDQTAFRFIARYDGTATLSSAITPYKGSNTQSPFVNLATSTS